MRDQAEQPVSLDYAEVSTIGDLLVRAAVLWPEKEAFVFWPDDRRTYADLLAAAESAARSLLGLGVRRGDRVGILMPNCYAFLDVQFACALIGVSAIPINARYRSWELRHVFAGSELVAVATTDIISEYVDFARLLEEATAERPPRLSHLIMLGDGTPGGFVGRAEFEAVAAQVPASEVHRLRQGVRLRDEAMLMYTSGTTAEPKGCVLTHEALVRTATAAGERWKLTHDERFWNPLPMFHMSQIFTQLSMIHVGATVLTHTHFDPADGLRMMERERCTYNFGTFPTITQAIVHHPDFERTDLSSIRLVNTTGAIESLQAMQAQFPQAAVVTLFGMTETCGGVSWGGPDDPVEKRLTTGGLPVRGMEVRIADPETDEEVPPGVRGEITVRGPGLFERYHNDPEKTAHAMRGGWFHTGDLGRVDEDGRLTYLGRLKDMLKVGGENVAALEVEAFLQTHPAVKIVQVVGVPDAKYEEVPAAFVEPVAGTPVTEEELVAFCREQIASFKIPRYVRFVDADGWPMSASKIQKFRLREQLLEELGLGGEAAARPATARG